MIRNNEADRKRILWRRPSRRYEGTCRRGQMPGQHIQILTF